MGTLLLYHSLSQGGLQDLQTSSGTLITVPPPPPSESTQRMTARHWSELANAAGPQWSDRRGRLRDNILGFGIPYSRISYVK